MVGGDVLIIAWLSATPTPRPLHLSLIAVLGRLKQPLFFKSCNRHCGLAWNLKPLQGHTALYSPVFI